MSERCFCHLNGLAVKDATARRELLDKVSTQQLTDTANALNVSIQNLAVRQTSVEREFAALTIPGNAAELPFQVEGTNLTAETTQAAIEEVNTKVDALAVPDATRVSFDGTDSGLEAENVQDAIGEVLVKSGTAGYNPETDSLWILKNGEKLDVLPLYTERYNLYVSGENNGEFESMALTTNSSNTYGPGAPTVTFEEGIRINTKQVSGGVISKLLDLSRFKKIKFRHYSEVVTQPQYDTYNAYVKFFICSSKSQTIAPVLLRDLMSNSKFSEGEIEIDISSLNGEYYIGFDVYAFGSFNTETFITNLYME